MNNNENNDLNPENIENVWSVNVNNLYTNKNTPRLTQLELKKRFVNYANKYPLMKTNLNTNGVPFYNKYKAEIVKEEKDAMNVFAKKTRKQRQRRRRNSRRV